MGAGCDGWTADVLLFAGDEGIVDGTAIFEGGLAGFGCEGNVEREGAAAYGEETGMALDTKGSLATTEGAT